MSLFREKIKGFFSKKESDSHQIKQGNRSIVFLGSSHIFLNDSKKGLYDCKIFSNEHYRCKHVAKNGFCDFFYTYSVDSDSLSLYCNTGDIYEYKIKNKILNKMINSSDKKISNQFYSNLIIGDAILMGHYPSGGLFKKSDFGESFASPIPLEKGDKSFSRELQSLSHIGGKLLVAIWPWGELWESSLEKK